MKYFIKTFGCAMNELDSERIAAGLEAQGYSRAAKMGDADLIIINTCSVRQKAEDKVYGLANKINELKMSASGDSSNLDNCKLKIVVTGCMVGSAVGKRRRIKLTELQRRMPWVDEFVDIEKLTNTSALHSAEVFDEKRGMIEEPALVAVMRGCDQFCSYCVVPYGRGAVRTRPVKEVVEEVECLVDRGAKWVMLLGQSINDYGQDLDRTRVILRHQPKNLSRMRDYLRQAQRFFTSFRMTNQHPFVELLRRVHEIKGLEKISLLSLNPWNFSDELVETLALPKFERYVHLPVQSGDDGVLKKMNRPYTIEEYKSLVKKIREKIPGVRIGTDAIVGFPGETKDQFQNTIKLFEELKFENAFILIYSERPGTAAEKLYEDDVPLTEKKRRHKILMRLWKDWR